jgi:hypothetical protein
MKKIFLFLLSIAVFAACERKIDEFAPNANGVDFSKFVTVGNSLTAGYADGALYTGDKIGQDASIANIIATQLKTLGTPGFTFTQPLIGTEDGVGFTMTPVGPYFTTKFVLKVLPNKDCSGNPIPNQYSLKPALLDPAASQTALGIQLITPPANPGPYNNMGVPGATVQTLFYPVTVLPWEILTLPVSPATRWLPLWEMQLPSNPHSFTSGSGTMMFLVLPLPARMPS